MTSGNESKVHGVKNGKVESKMQGNKEKNVNKSKSSEDVDESFSVDAIYSNWGHFSCESDEWLHITYRLVGNLYVQKSLWCIDCVNIPAFSISTQGTSEEMIIVCVLGVAEVVLQYWIPHTLICLQEAFISL